MLFMREANLRIGVCRYGDIPFSKPIVYRNDRGERCWKEVQFIFEIPRAERNGREFNNNKRQRVWREKGPTNSAPAAPEGKASEGEGDEPEINSQESLEGDGNRHRRENNSFADNQPKDQVLDPIPEMVSSEIMVVKGKEKADEVSTLSMVVFEHGDCSKGVFLGEENSKVLTPEKVNDGVELGHINVLDSSFAPLLTLEDEGSEGTVMVPKTGDSAMPEVTHSTELVVFENTAPLNAERISDQSVDAVLTGPQSTRKSLRLKINHPEQPIMSKAQHLKLRHLDYLQDEDGEKYTDLSDDFWKDDDKVPVEMLADLVAPFTEEEIKEALVTSDSDSSPGLWKGHNKTHTEELMLRAKKLMWAGYSPSASRFAGMITGTGQADEENEVMAKEHPNGGLVLVEGCCS